MATRVAETCRWSLHNKNCTHKNKVHWLTFLINFIRTVKLIKHLSAFSNEGMWGNGVINPLTLLNLGIIGTPRIFLAGGGGGGAD